MARFNNKQRESLRTLLNEYNRKAKEFNLRGNFAATPIQGKQRKELVRLLEKGQLSYGDVAQYLRLYLKRGSMAKVETKQGAVLTKFEIEKAAYLTSAINRKRKAVIEEFKPSTETGTMGTITRENLKPRQNNIQTIPPERIEQYFEVLERQFLMGGSTIEKERYRANLIAAIEKELQYAPNFEILINTIQNAEVDDVMRWYYTSPYANINFVYDRNQSAEDRVSYFLADLARYI